MPAAETAEGISQRINRLRPGAALILRSGPKDRVSKDGAAPHGTASCFETAASPPPQHEAYRWTGFAARL